LGGDVTVVSEPGKGSVFTVRLPGGVIGRPKTQIAAKTGADLLHRVSTLMALSGHARRVGRCPLSGAKRTSASRACPNLSHQLTNESPYRPALRNCLGSVEAVAIISVARALWRARAVRSPLCWKEATIALSCWASFWGQSRCCGLLEAS
jgi:hypothetical protein